MPVNVQQICSHLGHHSHKQRSTKLPLKLKQSFPICSILWLMIHKEQLYYVDISQCSLPKEPDCNCLFSSLSNPFADNRGKKCHMIKTFLTNKNYKL